ncbi:MAG: hypothetical protein HY744_06355 [Deltaproteobacteria bacterium]|nr:hypothetical protein [Deltaproteobacteria bacterium]
MGAASRAQPSGGLAIAGAGRPRRRPALRLALFVAAVAVLVSPLGAGEGTSGDKSAALAAALGRRGLVVDPQGVLWLGAPPFALWRSAAGTVPAVVRAAPAEEELNDIFLVDTRVSPEGALLEVGDAYNLTETSAADELRPVGEGRHFAFVVPSVRDEEVPARIRLFDLGGQARAADASAERWSWVKRLQADVTQLQQTGRSGGIGRVTYTLPDARAQPSLRFVPGALLIDTGGRNARVPLDAPLAVPEWLGVEVAAETKPGSLVTWAVDRVRALPYVGDEGMQYIKALGFTALDLMLREKEALSGDTGAEDIAADLGQERLAPIARQIPVDPEIGFPPPSLDTWVSPPLPGEGQWNLKDDDPYIRHLPGLPATIATTFMRGDRGRQATRVYVALWDPRIVELHMMPGVAEPKSATGETGPGQIPRVPELMRRLVAASNAGFQALHGEFGMMADGVVYLPPKPYAATVAELRDGSLAFGSWPNSPTIPEDVLSFRQNMTVMVQDQKFNPYGRTWWGGAPPGWEDKTHTVRTGICLTKEGFVAYFYGTDLSPEALARAMIQARCAYALGLDMNAGHSGMELYKVAPAAELGTLGRPLDRKWETEGEIREMPGWSFRARRLIAGMGLMNFPRYIRREGRDFFYLLLRHVLPGPPLAGAGGEDAKWRVKGLPQHGYPYALAIAETRLGSGTRVRVLAIDPRLVAAAGHAAATAEPPAGPVVALIEPGPPPPGPGVQSVWLTPAAFSVGREPPLPGAVRLATGSAPKGGPAHAPAAAGVQDEAGMLVYVEAVGADGTVAARPGASAKELGALLAGLGSSSFVLLDRPLALALGGDTDLAGHALRLEPASTTVRLVRVPGPRARRFFEDTPVVPIKEWYPLQARRIRYFRKKTEPEAPAEPTTAEGR